MSMRTNRPASRTAAIRRRMLARQRARSSVSPSAVSFTDTLTSANRSAAMRRTRSMYWSAFASPSSTFRMNSPRMSIVDIAPSPSSCRATRKASGMSGPAMYRFENMPTIGFGTNGRPWTTARSSRLMGSLSGLEELFDLALDGETTQFLLGEDPGAVHGDLEDPPGGRDQLGVDVEPLLQRGRQTGGLGEIPSRRAVFDLNAHRRILLKGRRIVPNDA